MKRFLAMVLAAWMVCATALGETSDVDEAVRKIFKMYKAVGGTVLAAKDGEIVYQYNYGFANRQSKTPVTENTYFRVLPSRKWFPPFASCSWLRRGRWTWMQTFRII